MVFELDKENSVANVFLAQLRKGFQLNDRKLFRSNMERLGEIMAYEMSKSFSFKNHSVTTPLGQKDISLPNIPIVIATILRAGLPFHQGFLNYFGEAESAFVAAYRKEEGHTELNVHMEYSVSPSLENKCLIVVDPMLATGKSLILALKRLLKNGTPAELNIAAIIAAPEGIENLKNEMEQEFKLWVGSVDDHLNQDYYIVPGLGDAGDLAYGNKI